MENRGYYNLRTGRYFVTECTQYGNGRFNEMVAQYKDNSWLKFTQYSGTTPIYDLNDNNYIGKNPMPNAFEMIGCCIRVIIKPNGYIQWYVEWVDEEYRQIHLYDSLPVDDFDYTEFDNLFK